MLVGIHHNVDTNGRYLTVLEACERILEHNGIEFVRLHADSPGFLEQVARCELFIMRWGHYDSDRQQALAVLPVVESELGVRCFPDMRTCWHYDDKVRQWLLLSAHDISVVPGKIFWDRARASQWARGAEYPQVFKLAGGAGSMGVVKVNDGDEALRLIGRMFGPGILPERFLHRDNLRFRFFSPLRELRRLAGDMRRRARGIDPSPWWRRQKNYVLFQQFLPGNEFDTRVSVIGGRAFAFRRMVRPGDWRASGSGRIDHDPAGIDLRCVEIAQRTSEKLGFYCMAYDFLTDRDGQPKICEISYTFQPRAVRDCPGWWDSDLNWHEGHRWPEYLHLLDLLELPELKQPELDY